MMILFNWYTKVNQDLDGNFSLTSPHKFIKLDKGPFLKMNGFFYLLLREEPFYPFIEKR
jgi:hypothetical protein